MSDYSDLRRVVTVGQFHNSLGNRLNDVRAVCVAYELVMLAGGALATILIAGAGQGNDYNISFGYTPDREEEALKVTIASVAGVIAVYKNDKQGRLLGSWRLISIQDKTLPRRRNSINKILV